MSSETVAYLISCHNPVYYATYADRRGYAARDALGVCWFVSDGADFSRLTPEDDPLLKRQQRCPLRRERSILSGLHAGTYALVGFPDLASVRV